jgi:hypothetical protein
MVSNCMKQTKNVIDEHVCATMKTQTGPEVKILAHGVLVLKISLNHLSYYLFTLIVTTTKNIVGAV